MKTTFTTIVSTSLSNTGFAYVDTRYVPMCGFETMAFPCNACGEKIDFGTELYLNRVNSLERAKLEHQLACTILIIQ